MKRNASTWILVISVVAVLPIHYVSANEFPTRQIEIIESFTPGSSRDMMSRLIADLGKKYLKQPIVVVNKPGAGGSIAAADVIASKPDGHKLVTLTNFFFATTVKTQKVPFEANDLIPIANFMEYKLGMFVKADAPWRTFGDLLDYGKKNPGTLRWAHTGRGVTLHMNGLIIFRKAGVDAVDIPYKGSPEQLSALLGGHHHASAMVYGGVKEQVKAGKVRGLVFFSDRRYSDTPDVPCAVELGFPEAAKLITYVGMYAHKDTPEDIRKILIDTFAKISREPELKKGIENIGEEPMFQGPEFMQESIRRAEEIGVPIIKELGLYIGK